MSVNALKSGLRTTAFRSVTPCHRGEGPENAICSNVNQLALFRKSFCARS